MQRNGTGQVAAAASCHKAGTLRHDTAWQVTTEGLRGVPMARWWNDGNAAGRMHAPCGALAGVAQLKRAVTCLPMLSTQ